jgi:hypothetical protein
MPLIDSSRITAHVTVGRSRERNLQVFWKIGFAALDDFRNWLIGQVA